MEGFGAEGGYELGGVLGIGLGPDHAAVGAETRGGAEVEGENASEGERGIVTLLRPEAVGFGGCHLARDRAGTTAKWALVGGEHGEAYVVLGSFSSA